MIKYILKHLIKSPNNETKEEAKKRLKLVLAQDRSILNAALLEKIRKEILSVVSKYVELDSEKLEFSIKTDNRLTALIANLPVRKVLNHQSTES